MFAVVAYHNTSWVYNVWYFEDKQKAKEFLKTRRAESTDYTFMPLLQEVQEG